MTISVVDKPIGKRHRWWRVVVPVVFSVLLVVIYLRTLDSVQQTRFVTDIQDSGGGYGLEYFTSSWNDTTFFRNLSRLTRGTLKVPDSLRVTSILLTGPDITDFWLLQHAPQLRQQRFLELTFHECALTDAGLLAIKPLPNLQALEVSNCNMNGVGLNLLTECPKLKKLRLDDPTIGDAGLLAVGVLQSLEELHLQHTSLTSDGLMWIDQQPRLTSLTLLAESVTSEYVEALNRLPRLKRIRINNVNDATVLRLSELRSNVELDLSGLLGFDGVDTGMTLLVHRAEITDASVPVLKRMAALKSIDVTYTRLTPEAVDEIKAAGVTIRMRPEFSGGFGAFVPRQ